MTRLTSLDVQDIEFEWQEYDKRIKRILGVDLVELSSLAADKPTSQVRSNINGRKLAAVAISSGEGVVGGFAQSLAAIGKHMGYEAMAMPSADKAGFDEASEWGADYVIYADDDLYIARELNGGNVADNNPATSRVFVAALDLLCRGISGKEVVVLGLGIIGRGAAMRLLDLGARPLMYDKNENKALDLIKEIKGGDLINNQRDLSMALKSTNLIFDATPVQEALDKSLWPASPIVAAPGVPLSWPIQWMEKNEKGRLWHDPLQSGTAAMLAML